MPKLAAKKPDLDWYPSSDGEPMAETPIHVQAIYLLHQALEDFFKGREDVFIASDIFWYWKEGKRDKLHRISPDVMVVPGVRQRQIYERRSFFSWIEDATPAAVFEMASRRTWKKDLGEKYDVYEKLGVKEYFLFDPEFRYLEAPLIGFRLHGKKYREIPLKDFGSDLGFQLRAERWAIRLIDQKTGEPIPTRAEAAERAKRVAELALARADEAIGLAKHERNRADELAAEVERLKKQLGRS